MTRRIKDMSAQSLLETKNASPLPREIEKTQDDVPRKAGPTRATAGPEVPRAAVQSQLRQIAVQPAVGIKEHERGSVVTVN